MGDIVNVELFTAALRMAAPLLLVAMGGLLCQRAKIFNIGLEGYMLMGAFCAILTIQVTGSALLGLLGGMLGGALLCLLYGVFVVQYNANHILTSIAANYLSTGLTSYLLLPLYGVKGAFRPDNMQTLPKLNIPILQDIPFIGPVFSGHSVTVYIALVMVVITHVVLFKTPFGMLVRSVGDNENAVRTAGVKPEHIKYLVMLWCGILCGLGGAHLATGYASEFTEGITQGRGFTAFAAITFGRAKPAAVFIACLVFGFADALGIRFELSSLLASPSVIKMFPYILAIAVLAVSSYAQKRRASQTRELF